MKTLVRLLGLLIIIPLAGCWGANQSVNKFNDESYLRASSVEPLKIPENLQDSTSIEAYYPAPAGKYPERGKPPISLVPPGLGDLIDTEEVVDVEIKETE